MDGQAEPKHPFAKNDRQSARNACVEFINEYHPVLSTLETYLQNMIDKTEPTFAQAYKPRLKGLKDLCVGVYLMSKGIALQNPQSLLDALKMFTFESALQFLSDLSVNCKLALKADWVKKFRQDIDTMLFAAAILNRGHEQARTR